MKKLLGALAGIVLAAPVGTAFAADLRLPVKAPVMAPVEVYNWTGFYAGVNVGYSWGRDPMSLSGDTVTTTRTRVFRTAGPTLISDVTTVGLPVAFAGAGDANINGVIGGGQLGYNWQMGTWLFGFEADLQGSGEKGGQVFCVTAGCPLGSLTATADHKLRWFSTLRARAGILIDPRVLLYVTGGLAIGQLDSDYGVGFVGLPLAGFSSKNTKAGFVVGGGVEGAVGGNWTVKAEYLYMDLGTYGSGTGAAAATNSVNLLDTPQNSFNTLIDTTVAVSGRFDNRFRDHIFRVGLNYRFAPAAVVARY